MSVAHWWNYTDIENLSTQTEICPLSTEKSLMDRGGIVPEPLRWTTDDRQPDPWHSPSTASDF